MFDISVIICTHNPRQDYLQRVLDALKEQTLPRGQWELLLIDNASSVPLGGKWDLSWHPNARHIRENELGLVPARLRGISSSVSELIVFVDDDNVLESNYLEAALDISRQWPTLGAWGGDIAGEFEKALPAELASLSWLLALRKVTAVQWSNGGIHRNHAIPIGAGMCIRRAVGQAYLEMVGKTPIRKQLDRQGVSLASSGDVDLAFTACDIGSGTGLFPNLRVLHLIPAKRIGRDYLLRLDEEVEFGHLLLFFIRGTPAARTPITQSLLTWYAILRHTGIARDRLKAHRRARIRFSTVARKLLKEGAVLNPEDCGINSASENQAGV